MKRKRSFSAGVDTTKSRRISFSTVPSLSSLSNETILNVFKFLNHQDLCTTQLISRRFSKLASDPLVWKSLYKRDYATRRSLAKPELLEAKSRRMRRLGTLCDQDNERRNILDWKLRYKIRYNWVHGRCRTTEYNIPQLAEPGHSASTSFPNPVSKPVVTLPHVDLGSLQLTGIGPHTVRIIGPRHAIIFSATHLYLIMTSLVSSPARLLYSVAGSADVHCHDELLALLTDQQKLLVIDISREDIRHVISYAGHVSDRAQLEMRTTPNAIIVSLISIDTGLIDNVLRIQEICISSKTRIIEHIRSARTHFDDNRSSCSFRTTSTVHDLGRPVYEHPFLLVPVDKRIALFHVRTTPLQMDVEYVKTLHGCTAKIKTCRVNRDVLFVVATGLAASRIWDMAVREDIFGTQIKTDHENALLVSADDQKRAVIHSNSILNVNERHISIRRDSILHTSDEPISAGHSTLVVHDFGH